MNIRLLRDGILLKKDDKPIQVTSNGFLIAGAPINKPALGTVLLTGPGKKGEGVQCAVGDTIMYHGSNALSVVVDDEEYFYITENSLIAVK